MRRTSLLLALALVLSTALPAVTPGPAAAHTCTLQADRPQTIPQPPGPHVILGGGRATCTQNGFMRLTIRIQHNSVELGWFTFASKVLEVNGNSIGGNHTYNRCIDGGWRTQITLFAQVGGHSHTQTQNSLSHWSGC
jgi:hypothetical protein